MVAFVFSSGRLVVVVVAFVFISSRSGGSGSICFY